MKVSYIELNAQSAGTMTRVRVRWKSVAVAVIIVLLILLIGFNMHEEPVCNEDMQAFRSTGVSELRRYCNDPHIPATGLEGEVESSYRLESVYVVIRHGDRSPLHNISNVPNRQFSCRFPKRLRNSLPQVSDYLKDMAQRGARPASMTYAGQELFPNSDECWIGDLTPYGAVQHLRLGLLLREKYINKHQLFESSDSNDFTRQVLVRGTTLNRTLQSAVALMYGFEPRIDMSHFAGVQCADNNTMCTVHTGHQCQCDVVGPLYLDTFAPTFGQKSLQVRNLPSAKRVASRLGTSTADLPRLSHIFDVAMTHFCHYMMPNCLGTAFARDIFDLLTESGRRSAVDSEYLRLSRLKSQPLLYEIAHAMKNTSRTHRFVLYSGHDSTVEPLAAALGFSAGLWPNYASRIVFELYSASSRYFVRILFNGKVVTGLTTFCKNLPRHGRPAEAEGRCPLEQFVEFVEEERYNGSPGKTGYSETCRNS